MCGGSKSVKLNTMTPVMIVEAVEPCLGFWTDRFGFTVENEVPGPDGKLIFASAKNGSIEVMYETKASALAEDPKADVSGHSIALFVTVDDIDAAEQAAKGAPVVKARHKTFYGSTDRKSVV